MKKKIAIAVLVSTFLYFSCKKEEKNYGNYYIPTPYSLEYGTLPAPNIPIDNPLTEEGVQLGRLLFYDKKLSSNETISCGTCHVQENGFTDTNRFSIGVLGLPGGRQAMTTVNMLWNSNQFFWDGRANLLRDQALLPIQDSLEMHETLPSIVAKLDAMPFYKSRFKRAFGSDEIDSYKISLALEQFMNSIVSSNSKFDKAERGEAVYTESERRGKILFFSEYNAFFPSASGADCVHCHSGNNFENDMYMNNGLDSDADMMDDGRMKATGDPLDKGKFKVPSLRNIALTAPYMHDGRFKTLEEVVDHYNTGLVNSSTLDPSQLGPITTGLRLDSIDKIDLINFLKTFTDEELVNNPAYSNPFE